MIMLFVVGHMAAIGLYAIPYRAYDPVSRWILKNIRPKLEPYLLLTSQWQQWNPAAPDPGSRVTFFVVEQRQADGPWEHLTTLSPKSISWHRRFPEFRIASDMMTSHAIVQQHYLRLYCQQFQLAPHTQLQALYQWYDLPTDPAILSFQRWDSWAPQWHSQTAYGTVC